MSENDPFASIPEVPSFTVTSADVADGVELPTVQLSGVFSELGGKDRSPQLSWSGAPAGTRSYVVTMHGPDAPTQSGFWHWALVDIPHTTTSLPADAGGDTTALLPAGAWHLPNDAMLSRYTGGAPNAWGGLHRYFIVVHALDVHTVDVPNEATPAYLSLHIQNHVLARAVMVPIATGPNAPTVRQQIRDEYL